MSNHLNDKINESLKTEVYPMLIRMTSSFAKAHASAETLAGARNTGKVLERAIEIEGEDVNKLIALRQRVPLSPIIFCKVCMIQNLAHYIYHLYIINVNKKK